MQKRRSFLAAAMVLALFVSLGAPALAIVSEAYDKKYLTEDQQGKIRDATNDYENAKADGDYAAMEAAHAAAEAVRAAGGSYSGGVDGSEYHPWNGSSSGGGGGGGGAAWTRYQISVKVGSNGSVGYGDPSMGEWNSFRPQRKPGTNFGPPVFVDTMYRNYYAGDYAAIEFRPDPGYQVEKVVVDGKSMGQIKYITCGGTNDHNVEVTFVKASQFSIYASADPGGTISPSGAVTVKSGGRQTFTFTPDLGYAVAELRIDGVRASRKDAWYSFTNVDADHDILVRFEKIGHVITASAGPGGSISPEGTTVVQIGWYQDYTITPAPGYSVADVKVDGVSVGAVTRYKFSIVDKAHTITATFKSAAHTITASAGAHGKISPAGAATVQDGASQAYTITPDTHYAIEDVKVDGASIGAKSSYTFSDVRADHTVSATFKPIKYTITASAGAHGSISPAGARSVQSGTSQSYTITPVYGYGVADVKVDGVSVGARSSYTFANITGNHTISATFKTEGKVDVGDMTLTDQDGKPFTTFKAGYGFEASLSVNMQFATITTATAKMSNGQTCQMELVGGKLVFVKNSASPTNARKYYVPVTTKDGTFSVTFTIKAVDAAGVALPNVTKTFSFRINGSMYDDDHTAPGR